MDEQEQRDFDSKGVFNELLSRLVQRVSRENDECLVGLCEGLCGQSKFGKCRLEEDFLDFVLRVQDHHGKGGYDVEMEVERIAREIFQTKREEGEETPSAEQVGC